MLHLSKLVILGSSWGPGVRSCWLGRRVGKLACGFLAAGGKKTTALLRRAARKGLQG